MVAIEREKEDSMKTYTGFRTTRRLVIAGVLWVLMVAPIGIATAQPMAGGRGPCDRPEGLLSPEDRQLIGDRMMQRMQDRLGLTQEQATEIRGVLRSQRDQARGEMQNLCEAREELRQLLGRQDADPAAVKAVTERVKVLQGGMLDRRVDTYLVLRSKLTPEQWEKWRALRSEMRGRFHRRGPVS
jgi:Spy/CpxP family protein refolding chaperone